MHETCIYTFPGFSFREFLKEIFQRNFDSSGVTNDVEYSEHILRYERNEE